MSKLPPSGNPPLLPLPPAGEGRGEGNGHADRTSPADGQAHTLPLVCAREREGDARRPRGLVAIILSVLLFPVWFTFWCLAVVIAAQFDRTREWARWLREAGVRYRYGGFTLIELSIVLVIIGLIVGGVLVGQSLIVAAAVRATMAQFDKFNTAANTFRDKYGFLPGDMNAAMAATFNVPPYHNAPIYFRAGTQGRGDGNGVLDGFSSVVIANPSAVLCGETSMFWGDLTWANLIEGGFTVDQSDADPGVAITPSQIDSALPAAKLGGSNHFMVYSNNSVNYFGILAVTSITTPNCVYSPGTPGLTVAQAYAIDTKIDDGLPQTGRVTANYAVFFLSLWAAGGGAQGASPGAVASPSSTTCYDNSGNASNPMAYSMTQNNGAGVNCALSFRLQAGD